MNRSRIVTFRTPEHQPSHRLRNLSDTYRVASDALTIAADLGCSGDLFDALWDLCQREATAFQSKMGEA